jgi:hypothetical protein
MVIVKKQTLVGKCPAYTAQVVLLLTRNLNAINVASHIKLETVALRCIIGARKRPTLATRTGRAITHLLKVTG